LEDNQLLFVVVVALTVLCAALFATPALAEPQEVEVDGWDDIGDLTANEILNDTEQDELVGLVVFAFTIGIIMTVLGFAMGMMWVKRR